jgi:hypothetical protein
MTLSPSPTDSRAPLRATDEGGPQRFFATPAPSCLAATRPQIDVRLTAPIELRLHRSQPSYRFRGGPSTAPGGAPVPRLCRPRARLATDASDTPCRAPRALGNPSLFRGTRTASTATPSKDDGFPGPEHLPPTMCSLRAAAFANGPIGGSPPPIPRLSHRDSASDACSPLVMLSHREARPSRVIRRLFARGRDGPRAACRLLQPNRTTSTDKGTFEPRAPQRWSPIGAALPAGGYAGPSRVSHPFECKSLERGQSRRHGSGARGHGSFASPIASGTSHRDRSRRKLCPNLIGSDTSCRKLVALQAGGSCFAGASFPSTLDEPARRPFAFASARLSDVGRLAAGRHPLGPPFTPLREELRNRPHPRCLPSSDGPVRG